MCPGISIRCKLCDMNTGNYALWLVAAVASAGILAAQTPHGKVERIKVHGKALEGNLEGDSADRDVSIYLPPSYATERNRRYPVIYLLHGYTDSDDLWFGAKPHFINVPTVTARALARGGNPEMKSMLPYAVSLFQGSTHSNRATSGHWESFVARDLVSYIDS